MNYNYDKEVDVLYISFYPGEKATTAVELNDNILLRLNLEERRAIGLTLLDFSALVQETRFGPRNFPLTGIAELAPDWQDMVIKILKSPPVNKILRVSVYAESSYETTPIAVVEKFSGLVAA